MTKIFDNMNYLHAMRNVPGMEPKLASLFDTTQVELLKIAEQTLTPEKLEEFTSKLILHPGEIEKENTLYVERTKLTVRDLKAKQRQTMITDLTQLKGQVQIEEPIVAKSKA